MYPIKFENIYFEKIWGGTGLEKLGKKLPSKNIGERWDIACHENSIGIVSNGKLKGMKFDELIDKYGESLLGKKISKDRFPLLIKLISANDKLSVQVHPDDEYAKNIENDFGKAEAWYVIDAKEGAEIILGTKNCNKAIFEDAIKKQDLEPYLNRISVKKGDMFYVKSGLVHAICEGLIIAEIQQNSDTTYRVYDFGRGRDIHVDKALDVIDFTLNGQKVKEVIEKYDNYEKANLCKNEFFNIEKFIIHKNLKCTSDEDRFYLYTCVEGSGKVYSKEEELKIELGDSFLIPAKLGEYILEGELTLLKSYVPEK